MGCAKYMLIPAQLKRKEFQHQPKKGNNSLKSCPSVTVFGEILVPVPHSRTGWSCLVRSQGALPRTTTSPVSTSVLPRSSAVAAISQRKPVSAFTNLHPHLQQDFRQTHTQSLRLQCLKPTALTRELGNKSV